VTIGNKDQSEIQQMIFELKQNKDEPLNKRLGRALSLVENSSPSQKQFFTDLSQVSARPHVFVLVGPSGVGKSVLIDRLLTFFLNDFKFIAVLATDPTSSQTGGALLGDRVRISENHDVERVFYRSIASRGTSKAFSDSIPDMLDVITIFGADVVLIETMGVAQQDTSPLHIADTLVNVLGPSTGDEIQLYKSGILEFGDIFFVNKSDLNSSDSIHTLLEMKLTGDSKDELRDFPRVLQGSALDKVGISELYNLMYSHMQKSAFKDN
jgi:LAO/AO transport system kinase